LAAASDQLLLARIRAREAGRADARPTNIIGEQLQGSADIAAVGALEELPDELLVLLDAHGVIRSPSG
jgi:hypothetical protein